MATEKTSLKSKLLDEQQSSSAVHVPSDDDDAAYCEADLSSPEAVKRALEGLTSAEHAARIALQGPNEIAEKRISPFEILVRQLSSSMAIMIEARARAPARALDRRSPLSRVAPAAPGPASRALAVFGAPLFAYPFPRPPESLVDPHILPPPRPLSLPDRRASARRSRSCSRARSRSGTTL